MLRSHRWRTAENSAGYLIPFLEPGASLLDVGCGPGSLTIDLAERVTPGRVLGIDLSPEVIEEASAAAKAAIRSNASFVTGDFRSAPLEPGSFDIVHAHQVLQHLRRPIDGLERMARLVRLGGIVAVRDSDYSAMVWSPSSPMIDRWREIYLEVTRRNQAEATAGRWLLTWSHQAGFSDVTYTTSTWTFATDETRRWWAGLWAERTVRSSFAEQAVAYGIAVPSELEAVADGWQVWAADPDAVFMVPHGEIIART